MLSNLGNILIFKMLLLGLLIIYFSFQIKKNKIIVTVKNLSIVFISKLH